MEVTQARHEDSLFFLVPARDDSQISSKRRELDTLGAPFVFICGQKTDQTDVVFREARGKWDALNFGMEFIPKDVEMVVMNDVDTTIHNFEHVLSHFEEDSKIGLVYCEVKVSSGPQKSFYKILNPIRKRIYIAASGELMLVRREVLERVLPIPPCLAEDSYIMFKALELGYKVHFCQETYTTTERTTNAMEEESYKFRTTLGIYQALQHSKPPHMVRLFYALLPWFAPLLAVYGENGQAWTAAIKRANKARHEGNSLSKF